MTVGVCGTERKIFSYYSHSCIFSQITYRFMRQPGHLFSQNKHSKHLKYGQYWCSFRAIGPPKLETEKINCSAWESDCPFPSQSGQIRSRPSTGTTRTQHKACARALPISWGPSLWGRTITQMSRGTASHFQPPAGQGEQCTTSQACGNPGHAELSYNPSGINNPSPFPKRPAPFSHRESIPALHSTLRHTC